MIAGLVRLVESGLQYSFMWLCQNLNSSYRRAEPYRGNMLVSFVGILKDKDFLYTNDFSPEEINKILDDASEGA